MYSLPNGHIGTIRGDQMQERYLNNLEVTGNPLTLEAIPHLEMDDIDTTSWDLRLREENERLTSTEDLKEVQIGSLHHQVTKLGASFFKYEEEDLITLLRRNINLFAWAPSDIPDIYTRVTCHL